MFPVEFLRKALDIKMTRRGRSEERARERRVVGKSEERGAHKAMGVLRQIPGLDEGGSGELLGALPARLECLLAALPVCCYLARLSDSHRHGTVYMRKPHSSHSF